MINQNNGTWDKDVAKPVDPKPAEPAPVPVGDGVMKMSPAGLEMAKQYEGLFLKAYQDSVGVWTIGYGRILYDDGSKVRQGEACTQAQADAWLLEDVEKDGSHYVRAWCKGLNQNQFDALSDFTFNRGAGRLKQLLAMPGNIEDNLIKFDWAGDTDNHLLGLKRRRLSERAMYLGQDWKPFVEWKP